MANLDRLEKTAQGTADGVLLGVGGTKDRVVATAGCSHQTSSLDAGSGCR